MSPDRDTSSHAFPGPDALVQSSGRGGPENGTPSLVTLAHVLDAIPQAVFWKDCAGVYRGCNEVFARTAGLSAAEIIGKTDFELPWPRGEAEGYRADDRAVIESGRARWHIVEPLQRADGRRGWVDTTKVPLLTAEGEVCGVLGILEDITERKEAEQAARQERRLSESAMQALPGVFFMFDERGRLLKWNRNVETLTGYTAEEIGERTLFELLREDCRERVKQKVEEVRSKGSATVEAVIVSKDGREATYYCQGLRTVLDGAACVLGIGIDISERKRAESELQQTRLLLAAVVEQSPVPMVVSFLPERTINLDNRAAREFLGMPDELVFGGMLLTDTYPLRPWRDILPDGSPTPLAHTPLERVLRGEAFANEEYGVVRADGTTRWTSASGVPIRDLNGEMIAGLIVFPDTTEHKQREARVQGLNRMREELLAEGELGAKLRRITDSVVEVFEADFARIWLSGPGDLCEAGCVHASSAEGRHRCPRRDRCLHLMASSGRYTHVDGPMHRRVPFGCYKVGRIASGESANFVTNNVAEDPRVHDHEWARELGLASFAGYRLLSASQEPIGVLALFSRHKLEVEDDSLLSSVATTASHVIMGAQAKEQLRVSEERWQFALEGAGDGVWDWNAQTGEVFFSRRWKEMLGYAEDEVGARYEEWESRVHPGDLPRALADLRRHLSGQTAAFISEHRLRCKDGGWKWILVRGRVVSRTADGRPLRVVGTHTDLTARKQADEALRASEQRFRSLYASMAEGVALHEVVRDERGAPVNYRIIDVNPRYEQMTGLAVERVLGKLAEQAYGTPEPPYLHEFVEVLKTQRPSYVETYFAPLGRQFAISVAPLGAERFATIFTDITERKEAERQLRQREVDLRRQNDALLNLMMRGKLFEGELSAALAEITAAGVELLQTERVSVWWYEEGLGGIRCADAYHRSKEEHSRGEVLSSADFPTYTASHQQGRVIATADAHSDVRTRELAAAYLEPHGIRSLIDAPVWIHGRLGALVCCEHVGSQRQWTSDDERVATTLATLVSLCVESAERRRSEAALRESETKYRALFESAGDATFLLRHEVGQLRVVECNQRALDVFGATREEICSLPVSNFWAAEQGDGVECGAAAAVHIARALEEGATTFEWRHRRRDGAVVETDVMLTRVPLGEGEHLLALVRDITQRKQAERELRDSEAKNRTLSQEFRTILDTIPGSLVMISPDLKILWANEFAASSLKLTDGALLGQYCYQVRHGRCTPCEPREACAVQRCFASGKLESSDGDTPDGRIWELRAAPVRGDQGEVKGVIEVAYEVTEHRRAVRELKASESTLRSVWEAAPIVIAVVVERKMISVNDSMCELTGYSLEEILHHDTRKFYDTQEEYEDVGRRLYVEVPQGGRSSIESRWRRKDGTIIEIALTAAPLRADDPAAGFVVTIQDITDRKRAERVLQSRILAMTRPLDDASALSFSDLFDVEEIQTIQDTFAASAGVAALITDPDGVPITQPSGFCRLCREFVRATEMGRQRCAKSDAELGRVSLEGPIVRPCLSAGLWGAGASITVGGKHIANWLIGQVRSESMDLARIERYAGELGVDPQGFHEALQEVPVMPEEQFRRVAHTLFVLSNELSEKAYQNVQQARFIADLKRTEEERARLEAQLRQAQKMEAIGQLAGGVAHDFNNILTAILGNVELATAALGADACEMTKALTGLQQIERSAQRAATLTRQLLAFSRRQMVQPAVLDLNASVRDLDKMLRRLLTENITLTQRLSPDLAAIKADAGQLEQVVMNLVVNARDAMPNGGHLVLETHNVVLDDAYVALHPGALPGEHVVLTVSDTGHGMDRKTLERVFEPFFTTKPKGQGTGLGLSTVYGIVKQSNGHVSVYSEPGNGTCFKVYLPAVHEALSEAKPTSMATGPTGTETLIICEDDTAVRELTARVLAHHGYRVLVAEDAARALRLAAEHTGPIQLLVTDVIMPGMNGRQLSEALTRVRPEIRTLFVSGYTSNVIAHHGVLDANVNFLEKPYSRVQLLEKIRAVLDKVERAMDSSSGTGYSTADGGDVTIG